MFTLQASMKQSALISKRGVEPWLNQNSLVASKRPPSGLPILHRKFACRKSQNPSALYRLLQEVREREFVGCYGLLSHDGPELVPDTLGDDYRNPVRYFLAVFFSSHGCNLPFCLESVK